MVRRAPLQILTVIPSLSGGGAERVLALLSRGLIALGHRVTVVTIFGEDHDFYDLPEEVGRVALNLGKTTVGPVEKLRYAGKRISALRRAIGAARPDVVVAFMTETNVLTLLAARRLRVPVVVTEHADPRKKRTPRVWKMLRRLSYRLASRVVSVSDGVDQYFDWLPASRRAVIANPVDRAAIDAPEGDALPLRWPRTVAAMGRLEPEKGYDLLLRAFARIAGLPDWGLLILGEGSQRAKLESLAADLGASGRVEMPGLLRNPFPTLKRADLFVLPSRTESFGNALIEALACGLPAIAADCWHRAPGIIEPNVNGLLVPREDVDALAAALADLMTDEPKRRRLASRAPDSIRRFDVERVTAQWDDLLQALARPSDGKLGRAHK